METVENMKYEPILRQLVLRFHLRGLVTKKLEFEKWTKCDLSITNIFWIYNFSSLDSIKFVAFFKS